MGLDFTSLLQDADIDPARVRLLRHQTKLPNGLTPFELWHWDRPAFEEYQSYQQHSQRAYFASPYWAVFLGLPDGGTMFVGLYHVGEPILMSEPYALESVGQRTDGGVDDRYSLELAAELSEYIGRLYIDWGGGASGKRAWRQRADKQSGSEVGSKQITELYLEGASQPFPGYSAFAEPLSRILALPQAWKEVLTNSKGVYLLTCSDTNEMYVGSATGAGGFLGRWTEYALNGHGGNVMLKRRQPSNYTVSILEVAGSNHSDVDVLKLEQLWKRKLQPSLCAN